MGLRALPQGGEEVEVEDDDEAACFVSMRVCSSDMVNGFGKKASMPASNAPFTIALSEFADIPIISSLRLGTSA